MTWGSVGDGGLAPEQSLTENQHRAPAVGTGDLGHDASRAPLSLRSGEALAARGQCPAQTGAPHRHVGVQSPAWHRRCAHWEVRPSHRVLRGPRSCGLALTSWGQGLPTAAHRTAHVLTLPEGLPPSTPAHCETRHLLHFLNKISTETLTRALRASAGSPVLRAVWSHLPRLLRGCSRSSLMHTQS